MRILLIDNFDSFTYNLVHAFEALDCEVDVIRNDDEYDSYLGLCDAIVLSPGPGLPEDAGRLMEIIENVKKTHPLLGVCLGHQALLKAYGGVLRNMDVVRHGESDSAQLHPDSILFDGLGKSLEIGLYHSWAVRADELPTNFKMTASLNGFAMGVEHKVLPLSGVQFHPESVLTPMGMHVLKNWINSIG